MSSGEPTFSSPGDLLRYAESVGAEAWEPSNPGRSVLLYRRARHSEYRGAWAVAVGFKCADGLYPVPTWCLAAWLVSWELPSSARPFGEDFAELLPELGVAS